MLRLKGFCLKLEHYHFSVAKCFQPTKIKFCFLHFCLSICTYGKTSVDGTVIRQTQHLEIHVLDLSASLIKQTAATKWGADACWAAAAACLQAGHGRKFTKGHAGYYIYIYKCRWSDPRNCLGTPSMCNCHGQPDVSLY